MSNKLRKKILKKKKKHTHQVHKGQHAAITDETSEQLMQMGLQCYQVGDYRRAEHFYRQVLIGNPDHAEANHSLGVIAYMVNRFKEAVHLIQKSIRINPHSVDACNNLGNAYKALGAFDEAIASYEKALALNADYAVAHNNLGNTLKAAGRIHEAIDSYKRALAIKPDYAKAHNNLGLSYKDLGQMDEAVSCYRKALALDPHYGVAWRNLAKVVKFKEYDEDVRAMEELQAKDSLASEQRIAVNFALAKAFEDIGQFAQSFSCIAAGNRLKRASLHYTIESEKALFKRLKRGFSPDFFSCHQQAGCRDKTPFFIVGMPRSGTTLVEQILASHPQVFGAGELWDLSRICQSALWAEMTEQEFDSYIAGLTANRLNDLGLEYIRCLRENSADAQFITDKMPHNFLLVGLIKTMLPNARVIHCKREPMDNCYSIFKHFFSQGTHNYSYDLEELGRYYTLYSDLMEHWQHVLPGFIYTVNYEELVADQQQQTRKLLEYCHLPWDESCLSFHKTERTVATMSGTQVRKPLYTDSVQLWKRYEMQLEPLRQAIFG